MPSKPGQGESKDRGNQQQSGRDTNKDQGSSTPQRKDGQKNPGNFGNDPKRASEAGRKGGRN
jgi:general stress protein YciG